MQSKNDKTDQNDELAFQLGEKRVQLGVGMQAKAIHKASKVSEDVVVYFGIIDFLQVRPVSQFFHCQCLAYVTFLAVSTKLDRVALCQRMVL